jgi:adenine phosphoribosyltransferase
VKHHQFITFDAAKVVHEHIAVVADFPKEGILFRDVSPVLADAGLFELVITVMCEPYLGSDHPSRRKVWAPDQIAGIDARGFIFGAAMAQRLDAGFVPVRKAGKLPPTDVDRVAYKLEYGEAELEIRRGVVKEGAKVLVVDDLLATGGSAGAAAELVTRQGGIVCGFAFMVELEQCGGRKALSGLYADSDIDALLTY